MYDCCAEGKPGSKVVIKIAMPCEKNIEKIQKQIRKGQKETKGKRKKKERRKRKKRKKEIEERKKEKRKRKITRSINKAKGIRIIAWHTLK